MDGRAGFSLPQRCPGEPRELKGGCPPGGSSQGIFQQGVKSQLFWKSQGALRCGLLLKFPLWALFPWFAAVSGPSGERKSQNEYATYGHSRFGVSMGATGPFEGPWMAPWIHFLRLTGPVRLKKPFQRAPRGPSKPRNEYARYRHTRFGVLGPRPAAPEGSQRQPGLEVAELALLIIKDPRFKYASTRHT